MNKNSVTTLQKGSHRSLSPVHIHLTDTTPLHVHLKKPVKPKPVYPKVINANKFKTTPKNVHNRNNNNPRNQKVTFENRKGSPADFDRSYESDEKFDPMEFSASQKYLMEKDNMLDEFKRRLNESKMENKKLVKDMEEICRGLEERGRDMYGDLSLVDPDLSRLANSQLFLQSIAVKMDDFGTLLRHIKEDRIPSISNVEFDSLLTLKRSLEHDLVTFDDVIIFLRRMMRKMIEEREESGGKMEGWKEKYEKLKKDMADIESRSKEAVSELDNHKTEQNQSKTIIESLKTTKAHLQRELTNREAEVNKLSAKVKDLQACLEREKEAKEKVNQDKENLKKATRLHKNKANQKSESLEQVNKALTLKDVEVNDLMQQLTSLRLQLSQVATEKIAFAAELNEIKLKTIPHLKTQKRIKQARHVDDEDDDDVVVDTADDDDDVDDDEEKGQFKMTRKGLKEKEKRIVSNKASLVEAESKASQFKSETAQLKLKVREFEDLLDDYKEQVSLSRREADKYRSQVDELKLELSRTAFEKEMSKPRQETKLGNENNNAMGSGKVFSDRIELLDKRIIILEDENKELAVLNGKREEALHQTNLRLEEKINEISALQRHLDTLMADMRRMKDSERDRITAAERSNQIHILELEGQINQLKHDIEKLKREKEEIERRLHQKMYDLQDELKQSHSTNRALQNFIHFLKSSYNATFDQPSLATFSSIPNLTAMGR